MVVAVFFILLGAYFLKANVVGWIFDDKGNPTAAVLDNVSSTTTNSSESAGEFIVSIKVNSTADGTGVGGARVLAIKSSDYSKFSRMVRDNNIDLYKRYNYLNNVVTFAAASGETVADGTVQLSLPSAGVYMLFGFKDEYFLERVGTVAVGKKRIAKGKVMLYKRPVIEVEVTVDSGVSDGARVVLVARSDYQKLADYIKSNNVDVNAGDSLAKAVEQFSSASALVYRGVATMQVASPEAYVVFAFKPSYRLSRVGTAVASKNKTTKGSKIILTAISPENVSGCIPLRINGDSQNKLDVVIVASGYTPEDLKNVFPEDANSVMNNVLANEPFASRGSVFNFYRLDAVVSLGSNDLFVQARQCPYDQILVITTESNNSANGYAGALPGDNIAWASKNAMVISKYVMLHEFGHSLGNLAEEYLSPYDAPSTSEEDKTLEEAHRLGTRTNCDFAGCSSWCTPLTKAELDGIDCRQYTDSLSCDSASRNGLPCGWVKQGLYGKRRVETPFCANTVALCTSVTVNKSNFGAWLDQTLGLCDYDRSLALNPVFSGGAVPSQGRRINFGKDCVENSGCYAGCGTPNWYRSSYEGGIMSREMYVTDETIVYSPMAMKKLVEVLSRYK